MECSPAREEGRPLRIVIAVHGYPPSHSAGAERRAERTARWFASHGHEVQVLCFESIVSGEPKLDWKDGLQDGVLVRRLDLTHPTNWGSFTWAYDNPLLGSATEKMIDDFHPSVLHLFSGYQMTASVVRAAVRAGVPVVVSLTDYWWLCHRVNLLGRNGTRCDSPTSIGCARCRAEIYRRYRLPTNLLPVAATNFWKLGGSVAALGDRVGVSEISTRARVLRETLGTASALVAPSQVLADFYVRHGVNPKRLRVMRQGVQINHPAREHHPSPTLRVGYLGQIKRHKGVDLLLDAWGRLGVDQKRELHLYGSDLGEGDYGRLVRDLLSRTQGATWHGEIRGDAVWDALSNLDVLVVPSRWVENSPNSILEAQAVGLPVVGSDLGGVAELVQHERNGLLFRVDDARDLARQLQRLIDEPALLPQLRAAPRFTRTIDDEMVDLLDLYEAVADGRFYSGSVTTGAKIEDRERLAKGVT